MSERKSRKLVIHDLEKYREAVAFEQANEIPEKHSLHRQVNYLLTGNYYGADELHIANDYCKHSFGFWFEKEGKACGFNGGIILHGLEETFTVNLCPPETKLAWSIHT